MALASLPLVLSLAVAPAQPARAELASTYDQATCATVLADHLGDADGWDRAAIGEDALPVPVLDECRPIVLAARDCNDPQFSAWVGEMIGTCDMPRAGAPHPSLRAVRSHDQHRAQRLLAELTAQSDSAAPLGTPTPERETPPALVGAIAQLVPPLSLGPPHFDPASALSSISLDGLLRPPRS